MPTATGIIPGTTTIGGRYYSYVYTPWLYSNADCGWLYQRAIATGSAYWWSRYDACANY